MSAPSLRREVDDKWSSVPRNLSVVGRTSAAEESAFLRYCLVVHFRLSKKDSQDGYEEVKALLSIPTLKAQGEEALAAHEVARERTIGRIRGLVSFLKDASTWYARVIGRIMRSTGGTGPMLEHLRAQANLASVIPLFLAIVIRPTPAEKDQGGPAPRMEFLNFRVYIAATYRTHGLRKCRAPNLAACYYYGELEAQLSAEDRSLAGPHLGDLPSLLRYRMMKFILTHCPCDKFRESLAGCGIRGRRQRADPRYFLMKFQQHLATQQDHRHRPDLQRLPCRRKIRRLSSRGAPSATACHAAGTTGP